MGEVMVKGVVVVVVVVVEMEEVPGVVVEEEGVQAQQRTTPSRVQHRLPIHQFTRSLWGPRRRSYDGHWRR